MKKNFLILLGVLLASTMAMAQAPAIFNYQGVARNSVGNVLVNKSITLRLTIHDGSAAGPVVYQETRGTQTNPFGLFNVQVGSTGASNVTGTIAGVPWGVGAKYIQVEIDPNGGTSFINIGTAQIASVPYAWFATLAGDLVLPFNKTQSDAGTLFRITNSGNGAGSTAIEGLTNSTAANASAITGTVTSTGPGGFSAGLRGINNGTAGLGIGVYGSQNGSGWGVYGTTPSGIGVNGNSATGIGVNATSSSGTGLFATSSSGKALVTTGGVQHTGIGEGLNKIFGSDAVGNGTWQTAAALGLVSGSGTLNFVPKWTPNGTTLGNSLLFDNGTAVGVNTITPEPTVRLGVHNATAGNFSAVKITNAATGQGLLDGLFVGQNGQTTDQGSLMWNMENSFLSLGTNSTDRLFVSAAGDVGVGTNLANPTARFQVNNTAANLTGVFINQSNAGNIQRNIVSFNANTTSTAFGNANIFAQRGNGSLANTFLYTGVPSSIIGVAASLNGFGVQGTSETGVGMAGLTTTGVAIQGISAGTAGNAGVFLNNSAATTDPVVVVNSISTASNAFGVSSTIASTTPGGFSAALRGINNGTGGLGIGVWGSQAGSGWGVYGTAVGGIGVHGNSSGAGMGVFGNSSSGSGVFGQSNTGDAGTFLIANATSTGNGVNVSQSGLGRGVYANISNTSNIVAAVRGETNGGGYGIFGQATGNGNAGFFQISNPASTSSVTNVTTNGIGSGVTVQLTNASNGARGVDVLQAGVGPGVFATSAGGNAVWGITSSISAAGVIGDNTFGEAVVGRNRGGLGVGAVVGRNDSTGYGVRGFNTKNGIGVLGQTGISGGQGVAGRFENVNAANTNSVVEVGNNGIGSGITVQLNNASNGARGVDVLQAGVGPGVFATSAGGNAVWGITSSISAAGVIGDNTFGEAVVGRNRGGNGVGAVVGRNDSTGYGVRGFNTKNGIGVLGQTGISGGTGNAGRFENVNAANGNDVLIAAGNGTGTTLLVSNNNAGATNLAIFRKGAGNVVRIADNGEIFANGGFTVGGADLAEYILPEGSKSDYEPGDVLAISQESDRRMVKSSGAYSTLVAGVYATKPGMKLTEENAVDGDLSNLIPVGVIGIIPTKVCTEGGAIKRGDLLVTSSISGVAMKADLNRVKVGQVIGKAMADFDGNGTGKINVLVSIK